MDRRLHKTVLAKLPAEDLGTGEAGLADSGQRVGDTLFAAEATGNRMVCLSVKADYLMAHWQAEL